jgi:hypothetical protein
VILRYSVTCPGNGALRARPITSGPIRRPGLNGVCHLHTQQVPVLCRHSSTGNAGHPKEAFLQTICYTAPEPKLS